MRVAAILLIGLAGVYASRRQSAAFRHWILALAILCASAVAVLPPLLPAWRLPAVSASRATIRTDVVVALPAGRAAGAPRAVPPHMDAWSSAVLTTVAAWGGAVQAAGAAAGLALLSAALLRLVLRTRQARPLREGRVVALCDRLARESGITRRVRMFLSDDPTLIVTWGLFRPIVLLPQDAPQWTDTRLQVVLLHELAHVRRCDWALQLLAEVLRAVCWLNPLAWLAASRLRSESERASDDEVLRAGVAGAEYASHLLALARAARNRRHGLLEHAATAMARATPRSSIERRVEAMLNTHLNRRPAARWLRLVTACASLGVAAVVSSYGAYAQSFGSLAGRVLDPQGLGIPGAAVSATEVRTEALHAVRSDGAGRFDITGLTPGEYRLSVAMPGFQPASEVLAVTARRVERDLPLAIGTVRESIHVQQAADAPPAPAPKPQAAPAGVIAKSCQATGAGGGIEPPKKILDVRPVYPEGTADEGLVRLDARIDADGRLTVADVLQPASPALSAAARTAVEQWRYTPTLLNCVPVDVAVQISVEFRR